MIVRNLIVLPEEVEKCVKFSRKAGNIRFFLQIEEVTGVWQNFTEKLRLENNNKTRENIFSSKIGPIIGQSGDCNHNQSFNSAELKYESYKCFMYYLLLHSLSCVFSFSADQCARHHHGR